ncbi:MAG: bifunctional diguanylate cyclase/phosphodiesterase [Castellaniella sp.]|uniref:putative bifunctional diguanylate cyclase/phosphodiesterase n=1 Tax=Castellaniella sp. TaxID=1955812 RepID=UPI00121002B1|nr:bifunctional diguanylate cyclase/phosphodiesterase [Castellaniella sp.]TAN28423.1 MAG: bifunctional diguanylate cyclase/phosphodiesterase [Castellaniella sp.]
MAPHHHSLARASLLTTRFSGRLAPFVTHVLAPLLIVLCVVAGMTVLPPLYSAPQGQPLATRFLAQSTIADGDTAILQLAQRPTRLTESLPAGPAWLLADLPAGVAPSPSTHELLLPSHHLTALACWTVERADYPTPGQTAWTLVPMSLHASGAGTQMQLQAGTIARQALCHVKLTLPDRLSVERWSHTDLADASARNAHAIGLLQGGLLTLALFLGVIALTMREWPYMLIACWLVGNMRLGAWALGWDYQWLGFLIVPDYLPWMRKLTLVLYYLITYHLFTGLFRESLDVAAQARVSKIGNLSSLALLAATLALPYAWFQTVVFLAAWIATGLVAILLIHALFRSHTRARLWHTVGVCVALSIMLSGLILVGLDRGDLIDPQTGSVALLLCNVLIALAVADQMREDRQLRLRERNDLIAHDSLTPLGLFTLGATRHFERLNPNARGILSVNESTDSLSLAWTDFFPEMDWLQVSLATEQGQDTEIQTKPSDTSPPRSFLLRATMAGSRIEGSLQDVSARYETIRNLRLMADNDPLTDTLNRRGIETAMQASIDALAQSNTPAAMAFLDLEHLKRVNDLFGHSAGDTLLQMVCERVKYSLDGQQRMGRVGNDEFIILFPNMHARDARRISQDIVESLNSAPVHVGERAFQLKTAIGLIDIAHNMTPKDAIAAASRACRDARKQHRDITLYEENAEELFEHIGEQYLFDQLDKDEPPKDFHLEMQPIMSLRHPLTTLNFEVLLRVHSSGERPVQTDRIIQAAEDNGMITAIDKWVFTTTLAWLAQHRHSLGHTQLVNINLSGVSLNDDRFMDTLFGMLTQHPQLSRGLCVEITEGVALQDLERTRQFMRRLQRMGTRVALDDFGAGYTSFSYLKELPADMIKIDGTLIRDMMASNANIAIVNSIVDLAHNLGMECIAEWVEDLATLRKLTEMGVDHIQGYIVSRSRAPAEILAYDSLLPMVRDPETKAYIEEISGRRI